MSAHEGPIEDYLDALQVRLTALPPRDSRHLLAEAEAHLRDATAEGMAGGLCAAEAERRAVERFGDPAAIVPAEADRTTVGLPALVRATFASGLLLGGIGAVAVGLSGAVAALIRVTAGVRFLVFAPPGKTYDPAGCVRWLALDPHARNCLQAALGDWSNETIFLRLTAGLLGILALLAFLVLRRHWRAKGRFVMLPAALLDTIAVAAFGLASLALVAMAANRWVGGGGDGSGQWLSGAVVALPAAGIAAGRLLNELRRAPGSRTLRLIR